MITNVQISIVDDEKHGRDYIALLLKKNFPELEIIFQAASMEETYLHLIKNVPDILFLDIQLSDGTAFDLLSKFKELPSQIIFITAYEQYAIQAIKNGATDYLLKPINKIDFIIAVKKALDNLKKKKTLQNSMTNKQKISLHSVQGFRLVNIEDIVWCEADSNYTVLYMTNKSKIMVSKTLYEFERNLLSHNFFRIHHKYLINMSYVQEYIKGKGGQVIMTDNIVLSVSQRKRNDFIKAIEVINDNSGLDCTFL